MAAPAAAHGGGADGDGAVLQIRRPKRRAGPLRERKRSRSPSPAEATAAGSDVGGKLRETRELQRKRQWRLNCSGGVRQQAEAEEEAGDKGAIKTLETAFDRQRKAATAMSEKHEALRSAYVEEELQRRRRAAGGEEAAAPERGEVSFVNPEDAVLALQPQLLTSTVDRREVGNKWLTGIQEIQLPIDFKIRSVEETEMAKAAAMGDAARAAPGSAGGREDPHHKWFAHNRHEGLHAVAAAQLAAGSAAAADRVSGVENTGAGDGQRQAKHSEADDRAFRRWRSKMRMGAARGFRGSGAPERAAPR
eukprot:TRINITY_DN15890_c0_g1_i1.p1 TRINITY_DN15890_c0_g1~~TRINITY_DN15890_c0_g1_i1.p1  ORF type:complete len:306 (+),score=88.20 TRINITY_DN15890_c0_g1_i1:86-1003(+)